MSKKPDKFASSRRMTAIDTVSDLQFGKIDRFRHRLQLGASQLRNSVDKPNSKQVINDVDHIPTFGMESSRLEHRDFQILLTEGFRFLIPDNTWSSNFCPLEYNKMQSIHALRIRKPRRPTRLKQAGLPHRCRPCVHAFDTCPSNLNLSRLRITYLM